MVTAVSFAHYDFPEVSSPLRTTSLSSCSQWFLCWKSKVLKIIRPVPFRLPPCRGEHVPWLVSRLLAVHCMWTGRPSIFFFIFFTKWLAPIKCCFYSGIKGNRHPWILSRTDPVACMNLLTNCIHLPGDNDRQIPCSCTGSRETAKLVLLYS